MTFDYSSVLTELKNRLSLLSSWSTTLYYGVVERLLEIFSYGINKAAYLAQFLYNEAGWFTAGKLSSLMGMAFLLGYTPYRKKGAFGNIVVSGSSTFSGSYVYTGNNVYIKKWDKFCNASKTINVYCSAFTTYYTNTVGNLIVPVKEGIPKEFTYIANGIVNEEIFLYSGNIENDDMEIYEVDALGNVISQVTIVPNLYLLNTPTVYSCEVHNSQNLDFVTIKFGDNISSKQLLVGTRILIKYAETKGNEGNITSTDIITKFNSTLYDNSGTAVTNLYVNNLALISDGTTYEDIESVRNNAPNLFGAGYRCGTLTDWNSVVNAQPGVYRANVWSINSIGGSTLISEQNKIFIVAIDSLGNPFSSTQKTILINNLQENFASPTEVIDFGSDSQKIYAVFDVTATIKSSTTAVVEETIKQTLYNQYRTLSSEFAQKIYQSDYITLISGLTDIKYHETQIRMMDYNLTWATIGQTFLGYHASTILTDQVLVTQDSPQIWLKLKVANVWQAPLLVAHGSGNSFIQDSGTFIVTSGSISYTSYTYSFMISILATGYGVQNPGDSDAAGYIISIIYGTQDGNTDQDQSLRLYQMYQITDVDPDYIFTTVSD